MPPGHRFPMAVFQRIYERLLSRGVVAPRQVVAPQRLDPELLELVHCEEYVRNFMRGRLDKAALRRMGLPWSDELVPRTLAEVAGTRLTAELALQFGLACNTAGGTHHAHRAFGSGFCIFNDLAVTAMDLLEQGKVERVLVVDCDVHQGDGTAALLEGEDRVFTLSVHCESNFPARKQKSDLDVGLPDGTEGPAYVDAVKAALEPTLRNFRPCLVLYDAGVDVHADDSLGRLNVSDEWLLERERTVLRACWEAEVPVAAMVGGGESEYTLQRREGAERTDTKISRVQRRPRRPRRPPHPPPPGCRRDLHRHPAAGGAGGVMATTARNPAVPPEWSLQLRSAPREERARGPAPPVPGEEPVRPARGFQVGERPLPPRGVHCGVPAEDRAARPVPLQHRHRVAALRGRHGSHVEVNVVVVVAGPAAGHRDAAPHAGAGGVSGEPGKVRVARDDEQRAPAPRLAEEGLGPPR